MVAVVLMILFRMVLGGWEASSLNGPLFLLVVVGWLLGLKVYRFWSDWGLPAAMVWMALQFQQVGSSESTGEPPSDSAPRCSSARRCSCR